MRAFVLLTPARKALERDLADQARRDRAQLVQALPDDPSVPVYSPMKTVTYLDDLEHRADRRRVEQVLVLRHLLEVQRAQALVGVRVGLERLAADGAVVVQAVEEVLVERLRDGLARAQGLRDERERAHHVRDLHTVRSDPCVKHRDDGVGAYEVRVDDERAVQERDAHLGVDL